VQNLAKILVAAFLSLAFIVGPSQAFLEDTRRPTEIRYVGPVGLDKDTWAYEYKSHELVCLIIVGKLHGKTVAVDCERR